MPAATRILVAAAALAAVGLVAYAQFVPYLGFVPGSASQERYGLGTTLWQFTSDAPLGGETHPPRYGYPLVLGRRGAARRRHAHRGRAAFAARRAGSRPWPRASPPPASRSGCSPPTR